MVTILVSFGIPLTTLDHCGGKDFWLALVLYLLLFLLHLLHLFKGNLPHILLHLLSLEDPELVVVVF